MKEFFENGATAFQRGFEAESKRDKERIAALAAKLEAKNEVFSELMEEHVALKKVLGSHNGHLGSSGWAGCGGRYCPLLVIQDGDRRKRVYFLAFDLGQ